MLTQLPSRRCVTNIVTRFLLLLLLCAAAVAPARAGKKAVHATGSISGQVTDHSGATVQGATVVLTYKQIDQTFTTKTDAAGQYKFANLPLGPATISITADGFVSFQRDVDITVGQSVTQNAVLTVASESIPISVSVVAPPSLSGVGGTSGAGGTPPSKANPKIPTTQGDYVIVSANAVAGPMGYVPPPSLGSTSPSQSAQQQALSASQNYNFPSIIFYISAAPLVNLPSDPNDSSTIQNEEKSIQKDETDLNPLWLDSSFTLTFSDKDGKPIDGACTDGSVQILGLLPQQTVAALKNQTSADIATGVNDVAGALASFYPGVQNQVSAATKALNVIFQDIFPPQPVAYEYSNMNGNCDFGWYFRPNKSSTAGASGPASILGIQTGIVLLKTKNNIASINVNGRSISAWNKPPKSTSKSLFTVSDRKIGMITLPDLSKINYDNLTSLAMFPALIPKSDVMQIVHIKDDAKFVQFAAANKLVGTNENYDYVTNGSLSAFLNLNAPAAKSDAVAPKDTPPAANPNVKPAPAPATGNGTTPPATVKPKQSATPATKTKTTPDKPKPAVSAAH
jgi:hypothetical protein